MDYVARKEEMIRLRTKENYTLQQIGNLYGISRERVRQIIGNSSYRRETKLQQMVKLVSDPMISDAVVAEIVGSSPQYVSKLRKDELRLATGGRWRGHSLTVMYVIDFLKEHGIEVVTTNSPRRKGYDFITDTGKRVICKSVRSEYKPPTRHPSIKNPMRKFTIPSKPVDVVIVHVLDGDVDDLFIIPREDLATSKYRVFSWPRNGTRTSKYSEYLYNLDYLK